MSAIGPIIDTLLRRVRDPHAIGTSRTFARTALSHAQRVYNTRMGFVLATETFTTYARRLVYSVTENLPLSARILSVRNNAGVDLDYEARWRELSAYSESWFRTTSTQHKVYSLIGRDLLILYPGKTADSTVSVLSTKLTTHFANDASVVEIPDANIDKVIDIAEFIVTLRNRNLTTARAILEDLLKGSVVSSSQVVNDGKK